MLTGSATILRIAYASNRYFLLCKYRKRPPVLRSVGGLFFTLLVSGVQQIKLLRDDVVVEPKHRAGGRR